MLNYKYTVNLDTPRSNCTIDNVQEVKIQRLPDGCECILTNPPYKYALEFVEHSLDLLPDGGLCVMFLKTTFLEGQKRYERLYKTMPPKTMLQFSKRVLCAKNGKFAEMRSGGGSAVSYAWFVWEKGFVGDTIVRWIRVHTDTVN